MIYVFLAEGFEEIEALTPVDCLRRAGLTVQTVGVTGKTVTGSHGISVTADIEADAVKLDDSLEMIVLPGGMPGTRNLEQSETVQKAIAYANANGLYIGAICAAPTILGRLGLLSGRNAVCFPGCEDALTGATLLDAPAVKDGRFITGRGAGAAMEFALTLVAACCGADESDALAKKMVFRK